jgi:hypothetical protein
MDRQRGNPATAWMAGPQYIWHLDYYLSGDSPDAFADYDPGRLADELDTAKPNVVAIFALNQHGYAYYPSNVAPPHPRLGGRDYTGTLLDALHRRGVRVLTYVNWMNIDQRERHPDWWQRDSKGEPIYQDGWGVPCPNGPARDYMHRLVEEVAGRFDTDGFFFDMFGFNGNGCWCEYCQAAYRQRYGVPLPAGVDWSSDAWRQFLTFRQDSAIACLRAIRDGAKAVKPNLAWVTHTRPFYSAWGRGTATLAGEVDDVVQSEINARYGHSRWQGGEMAQIQRAAVPAKNRVIILADKLPSTDARAWFYSPMSSTWLQQQVADMVANGAWPSIYTEPGPRGYHVPYTVTGVREALGLARQMEPYLLNSEPVESVALHFSFPSHVYYGRDDFYRYYQSFRGLYKALLENHIPFTVVSDQQILDGGLAPYALCILSNSVCTSDALNSALARYVDGGGSLLASYQTSLCDEVGRPRGDFGLAELLGVRYSGEAGPGYLQATGELATGLTGAPIVAQRLAAVQAAPGTEVAGWLLRQSPTDLAPFRFVHAPDGASDQPALVRRGRVAYCSADLGYAFMRSGQADHTRLLAQLVDSLVGDQLPLRVQAPSTVETVLRRQAGRTLLHLVNLTTNQIVEDSQCFADTYEVIPIADVQLRVRLASGQPSRVYRASDQQPLQWHAAGEWTVVDVPRLALYDIVVLEQQ